MRFSTITTFVLPSVVLAAPAILEARAGEHCAPTSYNLRDFISISAPDAAFVDFKFFSIFANTTGIEDAVMQGADCNASANSSSIPNNNVCNNISDRKLLFDLRGPQDTAHYQITHTWTCDGKTWMSSTDVTVSPLTCGTVNGNTSKCTSDGDHTIIPQNVRRICNAPSCQTARTP